MFNSKQFNQYTFNSFIEPKRVSSYPLSVEIYMSADRQIHAKLLIGRPNQENQEWVDVTDYLESIDVELGSIEDLGTGTGADIGVRTLSFTLFGSDFAPRNKESEWNTVNGQWMPLLWPYREVVFQLAVSLPGKEPSYWTTVFEGYLGDNIATEPPRVSVRCRDKSKLLQDSYIDVPKSYEGTISAEALIQQIINDYVPDAPPTLYCPVPSGITFEKMDVEYVSVWDAIQNVAKQIGWFLGYRWNGEQYVLTFMEPPRQKDTYDFDLNWVDDIYRETLDISDADIRNVVTVTYRDKNTGQRETVTVMDQDSIAEYRRRAMQIEEADTSLIDTYEKARKFAESCLWDLSQLSATDRINMPLIPEIDVFSTFIVTNPQISSTTDFYAVQSVRHSLRFGERARFRTEVIATGRVVGAKTKWQEMETRPGRPGKPIDGGRIPPEKLPPDRLPDYSLGVEKFMTTLKPPIMVTQKPQFPDPRYPEGTLFFFTQDRRLYESTGDDWELLNAGKLVADEILAGIIEAGGITADLISANGLHITNGKFTLTNADNQVIIDGTSRMFRIHQTGTATVPAGEQQANGKYGEVIVPFPDLGYRPAFLVYMIGTQSPLIGEAVWPYYTYYQHISSSGKETYYSWGIWASTASDHIRIVNYFSWPVDIRYYVLKEEAI